MERPERRDFSRRALAGVAAVTIAVLLVYAHVAPGQRPASVETRPASTSKARDRTPPSRPTTLAVSSVIRNRLTLTWTASTDNVGVAGYDVYRNGIKMTTVTTTSASQTGRLTCGTSYMFGVVARDAAGNSSKKGRLPILTSACAGARTVPPHFVADYQNGSFGSPLTSLFSYASPGFVDLTQTGPTSGTSDGRVKVVPSPSGSGNAARFEIRDSDPGWPVLPDLQKSETRTVPQQTFNEPGVNVGDVRWFSTRLYLPYTASEKFEWAHGGSNAFTNIMDLHPDSGTAWPAFSLSMYPTTGNLNQWAYFRVYGGEYPSTRYAKTINLWQLTNASGARVMSNYNRWIDLTWGMRFAPDSTGWLEVWVDGVNVYPRKNRPTMWTGDSGQYLAYGLYKRKDASFPETGRSVIYYGRTTIGLTKP